MHPERRCRSAAAVQLVRTPLNAATPRPPVSSAPRTRRGQTDSRLDAGGQALHNYRLCICVHTRTRQAKPIP